MKIRILIPLLLAFQLATAQDVHKNWFSDYTKAMTYAKTNQVPVLMVFAGSDWCKPCIMFKRDILTNEVFQSFAEDKMAILYLDFPSKKGNQLPEDQRLKNEKLAERFNPSGVFPEIILLSNSEKVLGNLQFNNQAVQDFINSCKQIM